MLSLDDADIFVLRWTGLDWNLDDTSLIPHGEIPFVDSMEIVPIRGLCAALEFVSEINVVCLTFAVSPGNSQDLS